MVAEVSHIEVPGQRIRSQAGRLIETFCPDSIWTRVLRTWLSQDQRRCISNLKGLRILPRQHPVVFGIGYIQMNVPVPGIDRYSERSEQFDSLHAIDPVL